MKKDTYRLDDKNEFDLIVYYDPGSKKPWETVIVRKSVNGIVDKKYLKGKNAALLKFILDNANEDHRFLSTNDLPSDRPHGYELGYSVYRAIRNFLGDYSDRIITERSTNGGVYFDITNVNCIRGETVSPPKVISVVKEEEPIFFTPKIPDDDRPVTPRKLWEAGRRTYQQSKAGGGRFRLLDIEEHIMPFYSKNDKRAHSKGIDLPIHVRIGESKDESSLKDALADLQGNYYLIGEGGIGKTTALFRIMEQHYKDGAYDPDDEIPLFVTLNHAPHVFERWYYGSEGMKSSFIRMEIGRQLLGCDELADVPDEMVKCITGECKASPENGKPKYLLLLDGLNEVSTDDITDNSGRLVNGRPLTGNVRQLIIEEIQYLLSDCPNVRIMLTSRTDEINVSFTQYRFEKLYLTGLKKDNIRDYLKKKEFAQSETDSAIANERLLECLVIPLFLTMYADLRDVSGISSRGEILSKFFHERGDNIVYTQQEAIEKLKFNASQLRFILDFLLPAIGWKMERDGVFEIQTKEIRKIIEPLLKGWKPTHDGAIPTEDGEPYDVSVIGEYGKSCFETYRSGRNTVETTAEEILASGKNMAKVTEYVMNCVMDVLKIMYCDKSKYSFIHHHFRDYFAAVHDINMLRVAVCAFEDEPESAFESLAPFIAHANRREKSIFIGEILGEHHNAPIPEGTQSKYNVPNEECSRNLIKRALDVFRGRFGEKVGYGVYNLIDAVKMVRLDMANSDFSNLDFTYISLNKVILGHKETGGSIFEGAKILMENLLNQGHRNGISCIAYLPDGKSFLSGSFDGTIKEWIIATGLCVRTYEGHNRSVKSISINPKDNSTFITGSDDCTIREWDRITGQCINVYTGHRESVKCVVFSLDGILFISGSSDKTIRLWQKGRNHSLITYKGHSDSVTSLAFATNGKIFISGSEDGSIMQWNIHEEKAIFTYKGHLCGINSIVFSPCENGFLSASKDNTIIEWQMDVANPIFIYQEHKNWVTAIAYSPNGKSFISGSKDRTIKEWQIRNNQSIFTYSENRDWVRSVAFAPDGKSFLSGLGDNTITQWSIELNKCLRIFYGHVNWVSFVAFSPDSKILLYGSGDNNIKAWSIIDSKPKYVYEGHKGWVRSVAFAPDGKSFISGSKDKTIREWSVEGTNCLHVYEGHKDWVCCVSFAPDGKSFISGSWDNIIKRWHVGNPNCIHTYKKHSDWIRTVAYAPDGKSFISGSADCTIMEWDTSTGQCINTYVGHENDVNSVAYAPDGKSFISASLDGTIKEWRIGKPKCLHTYKGNGEKIRSVAYAPDGKSFISGSFDGTVREWYVGKPHWIREYNKHNNCVECVVYAPDGKSFASASDDIICIWSTETGECLQIIYNYSGLIVYNCDLRHLHPDSDLSDEDKDILRRYGAIVD